MITRRGWSRWRGGSGWQTAEAAEGEDPAGPKDVGIGKASCMFKSTLKIQDKMVEGDHVVHCFEAAVPTHGMDALVNTLRKVGSFLTPCKVSFDVWESIYLFKHTLSHALNNFYHHTNVTSTPCFWGSDIKQKKRREVTRTRFLTRYDIVSISKKKSPAAQASASTRLPREVGGEPKIVFKRYPSVSNSTWESNFQKRELSLYYLKIEFLEYLQTPGEIRYPNGPIGYWKKVTIWKEACIVHVGAVIHDYQGKGAIWSRKCQSWKHCPGAWAQLSTDNVNFMHAKSSVPARGVWTIRPGPGFLRFF